RATGKRLATSGEQRYNAAAYWGCAMKKALLGAVVLVLATASLRAQSANSQLGTIHFPTCASPAAHAPFLVGVKALFNFEFDTAAEAFQQTQKADPGFALGYWGEAMSFNHP